MVGCKHLFIPDTQVRSEVPINHFYWLAYYAMDKEPDKIIWAGDHFDMPSLSSYDKKGSKSTEGRRVRKDISAGERAMDVTQNIWAKHGFEPVQHITLGNHCNRWNRALEENPAHFEGMFPNDDPFQFERWGIQSHEFLKPVRLDGVNYCLAPEHRILTKDLRWVPLGEVKVGQELVAFEETATAGRGRCYTNSIVEAVTPSKAVTFKVTLQSGKTFTATGDHRWLVRRKGSTAWAWVHTTELKTNHHETIKLGDTWETDTSYEAGWLAGIFDGEGWISKPGDQTSLNIGFAQNEGLVLQQGLAYIDKLGANYKFHDYRDCKSIKLSGSSFSKLAVLGKIRPIRLIDKFDPTCLGRLQQPMDSNCDVVVSVEPNGVSDIVQIQTSSGTMIVDGYPHHNCHYFPQSARGQVVQTKRGAPSALAQVQRQLRSATAGHQQGLDVAIIATDTGLARGLIAGSFYLHNESYLGPINSYWRGLILKHDVHHGNYNLCEVDMKWLRNKYSKLEPAGRKRA